MAYHKGDAPQQYAPSLHLPKLPFPTDVRLATDYVNFLLLAVPVGIVAGACKWNSTAVFTINFFAIIPLAAVLSFATEEISMKLGETLGGLLNATFGNAVELIVRLPLRNRGLDLVSLTFPRSALSPSKMARSRLSSRQCWALSCPTCC